MEAIWALSNATAIASPQQFGQMVDKGLIKALADCLKVNEQSIVTISIEGLNNVLKCGQEFYMEDGFNKFAIIAESNGLLDVLEELQYHKNTQIYEAAVKIIENYFDDAENDMGALNILD